MHSRLKLLGLNTGLYTIQCMSIILTTKFKAGLSIFCFDYFYLFYIEFFSIDDKELSNKKAISISMVLLLYQNFY